MVVSVVTSVVSTVLVVVLELISTELVVVVVANRLFLPPASF